MYNSKGLAIVYRLVKNGGGGGGKVGGFFVGGVSHDFWTKYRKGTKEN